MKYKVVAVLFLLALGADSFAQNNMSIPVDSWTYDAIQQLQTRGYLLDLSPASNPIDGSKLLKRWRNLGVKPIFRLCQRQTNG